MEHPYWQELLRKKTLSNLNLEISFGLAMNVSMTSKLCKIRKKTPKCRNDWSFFSSEQSLKIGVERKMCQWSYLLTKKHFLVFQNWIKECAFRLSVFRGYIQENFLTNKKCLKLCTQNTLLLCLKNKLGEKNDMCNKVSI